MLELSRHLKITEEVCGELNLTNHFDEKDLEAIGETVWEGYEADEQSRTKWLNRTQAGMDLAI